MREAISFEDLKKRDKENNLLEYLNDVLISNIRAHRIHKGFSQRELSRKSGITQNIISRMENGHATPEFKTLIKLAETLQLDVDLTVNPKN